MITKERLQELIEKEATVYTLDAEWKLTKKNTPRIDYKYDELILNCHCEKCNGQTKWLLINVLYETVKEREQAEWEAEFGNVEKVVKMPRFLNWEELQNYYKESDYYSIRFVTNPFNVDIQYLFSVNLKNDGSIYVCKEVDGGLSEVLLDKPFNEENYTEACRLIKKLFMGEE